MRAPRTREHPRSEDCCGATTRVHPQPARARHGTYVDELQQALVNLSLLLAAPSLLRHRQLLRVRVVVGERGQVALQRHADVAAPHALAEHHGASHAHLGQLGVIVAAKDHWQAHRHRGEDREGLGRDRGLGAVLSQRRNQRRVSGAATPARGPPLPTCPRVTYRASHGVHAELLHVDGPQGWHVCTHVHGRATTQRCHACVRGGGSSTCTDGDAHRDHQTRGWGTAATQAPCPW